MVGYDLERFPVQPWPYLSQREDHCHSFILCIQYTGQYTGVSSLWPLQPMAYKKGRVPRFFWFELNYYGIIAKGVADEPFLPALYS